MYCVQRRSYPSDADAPEGALAEPHGTPKES